MSCSTVRLYGFAKIHKSLRNTKKEVLFFLFCLYFVYHQTLVFVTYRVK